MIRYQQDNPSGHFRVVFMHGSGGGPDTPFMTFFAEQCQAVGAEVVRPDFPYWEQVRASGKPRPPDRMPKLESAMRELLQQLQGDGKPLLLMGKSLGSRVMLRLADDFAAQRLVALGFPFHPPQRPERSRLSELSMTSAPGLILQGTRDPFSKPLRGESVELPQNWRLSWLEGADHGFAATRAKADQTPVIWQQAGAQLQEFIV